MEQIPWDGAALILSPGSILKYTDASSALGGYTAQASLAAATTVPYSR